MKSSSILFGSNWPYRIGEGIVLVLGILIIIFIYNLAERYTESREESNLLIPDWLIKVLAIIVGIIMLNVLALVANTALTEFLFP